MARRPSARLAVSAQRFLTRRMEHALVRRDVAMDDDPIRAQSRSLAAGCVLAAVVVAGCAVVGLVRPQGAPGDAPIVLVRETGALYVRSGDTWHPVYNLASARLVARSNATPVVVSEASLATAKRGPRVGIAGAPAAIGAPLNAPQWTVCDASRTVVLVGVPMPPLDPTRTVLVTPRGEAAAITYLLYEGRKAAVDLRDRVAVRALGLEGIAPQPVSQALLDTVPEARPLVAPRIADAGTAGPPSLGGLAVGSVVRVARTDVDEFFVVLADGVQRVGPVVADMIRFAYGGPDEIPAVTPAAVAATSAVDTLPVGSFPRSGRDPLGLRDGALVCVQWRSDSGRADEVVVLTGSARAMDAVPVVELAQSDDDGPRVDGFAMPGGSSAYVAAASIVGAGAPRFVVTESGVIHGIRDQQTAGYVGFAGPPSAAPWSILGQLPAGPELSSEAASVLQDGIPPPA